ncbi:ROM3, partial [Symbiodinium pilosum]
VLRSFELLAQVPANPREMYFAQALIDMFQEYVQKTGVDLSDPEIPPEMERLWSMVQKDGAATKGGRVFAEAEERVKQPPAQAQRPQSCQCRHVAPGIRGGGSHGCSSTGGGL